MSFPSYFLRWYCLSRSGSALLALACGAFPLTNTGATEKRVALVMGVWDYDSPSLTDLPGIEDDVKRFSERLRQVGFEVTELRNPGLAEAKDAVDSFAVKLNDPGAVGLFYFSGHGGEFDGANFLIPKTARISTSSDLDSEALNSKRLLNRMESSSAKVNLVFLDCCRNEFTKAKSAAATSGGMAPMSANGTFIGFATASAKEANASIDGSVYTNALLNYMGEPGLSITDMHTKVTGEVVRKTGENGDPQVPFQYSGLSDLFYFVPSDKPALPPPLAPPPPDKPIFEPIPRAGSPWLFPASSEQVLTARDLAGLDANSLWRARNEIYARNGYIFATQRGQALTALLGNNYRPRTSNQIAVSNAFNAIEQANIELIKRTEGGAPSGAQGRMDVTGDTVPDTRPRADAGGVWLIPDSSARRLTRADLTGLSKAQLWRARNEIYARHGFIFSSDRGRAFTRSLGSNYQPRTSSMDRIEAGFNAVEQANVELIKSLE